MRQAETLAIELSLVARQMNETIERASPNDTMTLGHFSLWICFALACGGCERTRRDGEMDNPY